MTLNFFLVKLTFKTIHQYAFLFQSEELTRQKALRAEMIQLEDVLGQLRKEYEMLRIEFEQNLAANEQTGPINREMRHLITSLQNHNQQLKGEVHRYKRKYKDTSQELNKVCSCNTVNILIFWFLFCRQWRTGKVFGKSYYTLFICNTRGAKLIPC